MHKICSQIGLNLWQRATMMATYHVLHSGKNSMPLRAWLNDTEEPHRRSCSQYILTFISHSDQICVYGPILITFSASLSGLKMGNWVWSENSVSYKTRVNPHRTLTLSARSGLKTVTTKTELQFTYCVPEEGRYSSVPSR